jgi:hypothetical protein
MRRQLAVVLTTVGFVAASGFAPAAAGADTFAAVTRVKGLAGYHFRVSKAASLTIRGSIAVPRSACGSGRHDYGLQIGAGFSSGGVLESAIVSVLLDCARGRHGAGATELVAGFNAREPARRITPGEVIRVKASVNAATATAAITYPSGKTVSVSAGGGKPTGGDYALTLPDSSPPRYSTVTFTRCTVNKKNLSAVNPRAWESVTSGGAVDGTVSSITGSNSFTITSSRPAGRQRLDVHRLLVWTGTSARLKR